MQRSMRLRIILTLAEREELALAGQLQKLQDRILQEQQQLDQLQGFARDYAAKIRQDRLGLSGVTLSHNSLFLGELYTLNTAQEQTIDRLLQDSKRLREQWVVKYQRRQAIAELLEKYRRDEATEVDKRLQKEVDELALRAWSRP